MASRELPLLVGRRRLPVTRPRFWGCRHSIRRYSSKQCALCTIAVVVSTSASVAGSNSVRVPPCPRVSCPVPAVRSFRSLRIRLRLYTGSLSSLALALLRPLSVSSSRVTAAVDVVLSSSRSLALAFLHRIRTRARALPAPGLRPAFEPHFEVRAARTQALLRLLLPVFPASPKLQLRGHRRKIKI